MSLAQISIIVEDADGDRSSINLGVPLGSLTINQVIEFGQDMCGLVNEITDAKIVGLDVIVAADLPEGLKSVAVAYSEVQKGGLFNFSLENTPYTYSVRVPALKPSLFTGDVINAAQSDVINFISAMVDGETIGGDAVEPCNKFEFDVSAFVEGVKSFRRR
jgi:hypothetical protein